MQSIVLFTHFTALNLFTNLIFKPLLYTFINLGDRIIALRKQKNMSQADFSKAVGVSREITRRHERNKTLPSIEVAKKIADTFDVSMDFFSGTRCEQQL